MFPQWGNTFQTMDPSQQMYWQQYYGYQPAAPMWGSPHAPQSGASGVGPTVGTQASQATAAVLPPEPPKDEAPPPPLPAEPPPPPVPEEPQPPSDSHEQQKLTALQQQAAQWQQQKQWQEYQQSLLQYQQQLQQWTAQQASILEQINQEEKEFEMQYSDWMKQYNDWKEQNKNHPNREQYLQYEQQWKQYEEQMAQKREFIKQRKTQALMNQQMAQTPTTNTSGYGGVMDQGVSVGVTKLPDSKPEPVSASASSFASSTLGGGMIYTSSDGQPSSVCPPPSSSLPYSGYSYGAGDYATGQGGVTNPRFPQPPMGQATPAWPDSRAVPPAPPQSFDESWNQPTKTTDYGMKHPAAGNLGMHAPSEYGGQRQQTPSDFGMRKPGPMGFGMAPQQPGAQVRQQLSHGPMDTSTGKLRSDFTTSSDETQSFMRKMEMPPASSSANYPGHFRNENQPASRFQQPEMSTRFPGPRGPGMPPGMYEAGGRPPGPQGIRMPQQDTGMSLGPSVTSSSDSSYTAYGQGMDFSHKDANVSYSSAWGSASAVPPYDATASHFMGPPRFSGPTTSQQSSEYDSRSSGPVGPRMPVSSQQLNQYPGPSISDQTKQTDYAPSYPGMSGPRFPQPPNVPEAVSSSSGFLGNRFESKSSSAQQLESQFPGPRMPNQFSGSNPPQFDSEHGSSWSGDAQNPMQQASGASRFPGPRGPGMGPELRQSAASGQSRFSGPFGPGIRPDNEQANSGNTRYPGPQGPGFHSGFQQGQMFGDSRYPGPRGPGMQQDFQQDRGFGDARFPWPHGPGMGPDNQPPQPLSGPGGPRFPGPRGPRMGAELQQDTSSGEARFSGPRGPDPRPDLGSGERFPRPRGPDFQQEPTFGGSRLSGPTGLGSGQENQQGGGWVPRSAVGIDSGSRFSQQGPQGPNNQRLNEQQGPPEMEKKFSGVCPPTSGPRPLLTPFSVAQSSVAGVKTSAYEPFGSRGVPSQAGSRMPPPNLQSTALTSISSDVNIKPEVKNDSSKEPATSKPSDSLNKPNAGLNKESPQSLIDSSKVSSSTLALTSSSAPQNFQLPGQGVRLPVGSQGLTSTTTLKFDPMGRGVCPPGPHGEGSDLIGRGVRPSGPRGEGPDPMGRGIRPPGPRGEGPDLMGHGIRPPGLSAHPRFSGGPDARASAPGPRGLTSDAGGMKFSKWQAPGGTEFEEVSEEVEQIDPEFEHHAPLGFDPRGRVGFSSGPRFPAPGLMPGMPRGVRPPFFRGPDPRFRPRMPPGVGARMQYDMQATAPYSVPADSFPGEGDVECGAEEQADFSQDYGEEGFFGKRKAEEVEQEFGIEETYEEEAMPPATKFGRMDSSIRPPFPRMPAGRGFGPRGPRFDAPFGGPMGMRPRFDPVSGRMVRPFQPRGGPVPLMQLSIRPPVSLSSEQPPVEEAVYGEEEYTEELETEGLEAEAEVLESGRFMHFGPRGPPGIRGGLPRPPMAPFGPKGSAARWPRPSVEEFRPGMGRGGLGGVRGPGPLPGFGKSRTGFPDDSQKNYTEEAFIGLQPPDAMYDEEGNPVITEENWGSADYAEEQEVQEEYGTDDPTGKVDSDGAPIQFSEREHELIKKAAEELKLLSQTLDPVDVLSSTAPVLEKPKPPTSLAPYPRDNMRDETEEPPDYEGEHEYLDRDDRFIRGERPLRGRFHDEPSYPDEEFGAEPYASDSFRGPWHEEDLPKRPLPPDFDYRGPMRDFEPGFHEPPWREDPDFREGRFPRSSEDLDRIDRRPFEGRWGPPPDWDRRSPPFPPERGPRGLPLPPLPNPREFLENLEGRARPPPFGHGPPPPPPPFDGFPPSGTSAVFDYGHGEPGGDAYGRHSQNAEPEDFWPDRDEDMRFRGWERDRDLRHERDMIPGDFDRDRRPPFPDIHERGGWPEHRERDFPGGSRDRDRGSRSRDYDSRSSSDRGSREPPSWNREHRSDRERDMRDRERDFRDQDRRGLDRDEYRDRGGRSGGFEDHFMRHPGHGNHGNQGPQGPVFVDEPKLEVAAVDDLLILPGRRSRPDHIVVIIRGLPGAGKTFVSKLLKDKEVANGGTAPRMLCLDDYFMVETEKMVEDPETGKKAKKTVMEYEYDPALEPSYKVSFLKSFKRQIDDCYFNFIIVDAVFDKVEHMDEFWSYAKSKGFQVYVVEMQAEVGICAKRNTHQRKQSDIQKILDGWDETPRHYIRLDVRSLLQDAAIEDVEMEDTTNEAVAAKTEEDRAEDEADEDAGLVG